MKHVQTARKCDCGKAPKWFFDVCATPGKKKTRPLQRVSNFNSPMSPPWRHPFLRNRSLVPWHHFCSKIKSHVICNGTVFYQNTSAGWWGTLPMYGVCCGIQSFHTSCPGQKGWLIGFVSKGRKKWRFSSWFTKHYDVQMDYIDQTSSKSCVIHRCIIGWMKKSYTSW